MTKDGFGEGLDVGEIDVVFARQNGAGFGPQHQKLRGPRARAVGDVFVHAVDGGDFAGARGPGQPGGEAHHRIGDRHAAHQVLQAQHFVVLEDHAGDAGQRAGRPFDDLDLLIDRRVLHLQAEHEAIDLRFGERVRPFHFDRILRGDDVEGRLELVRLPAHRHFSFLHGLQQRGLRLGRGAVDFVGQKEVGKHRTGHEFERVPAGRLVLFDHVGARNVRRHQVGSELDPTKFHVERSRQRPPHEGLAEARDAV